MSYHAKTLLRIIGLPLMIVCLNGCSTTETINDFLSSTTPGDWYNRDGMPKAEHKVDVFVAINIDNLKADLARGQGEYLEALSVLLTVAIDRRQEFSMRAQNEYSRLANQDRAAVTEALVALSQGLRDA